MTQSSAGVGKRVLVAMSGGVDSSVAAALMVARGFEAVGVTLRLVDAGPGCRSRADADDARRVAEHLGMRFLVADYAERFRREVVEPFADEYLAGRTPIPCVTCNASFKFESLLERGRALGASGVASGHYARVDRDPETGLCRLRRAEDASKDQSYFLFRLGQDQLAALHFPLGEMKKTEVREVARGLGLANADKPESQEICFIPDGDYTAAVERIRPGALPGPGELVDGSGRVLGRHRGVHRFTVGQRRGLGLSAPDPLYVTAVDAERNRVRVGGADELLVRGACVERVSWIAGGPPPRSLRASVQVRHRHQGASAEVEPLDGARVRVHFERPVRAVAPGQAAVFYQGDTVLGGGWIAGSLP
jgi:tRNA-specific 2-thiouridylase